MTRAQIHEQFVSEFHAGSPVATVTASDLATVERELGIVLPESYHSFMLTHGTVRTPSLLDLVVDLEAELWAISDFIAPAEIVRDSRLYWSGGMSEQLVGFAGDGMGNMFCFRRSPVSTSRPDDASVWFFDHEFCDDIHQLEDSFDSWLFSYLKLKRPELKR
jgi:hypothetical protein